MSFFKMKWVFIYLLIALCPNIWINAQDVTTILEKSQLLIDKNKYKEAYKHLLTIDEKQIETKEDTCVILFNYEKGTCLYYLNKYEEAIPCLNKALLKLENTPTSNCVYLELIYRIGSCYKKLKQFKNAEKYYRRVLIRGKSHELVCSATTKTYRDLAEIYNTQGLTEFADLCTFRMSKQVDYLETTEWRNTINELNNLAISYQIQEKYDKEISCYKKMLNVIEEKVGKGHDEYISYCYILGLRYSLINRTDEALSQYEQLIEIGKTLHTKKEDICEAYEECLTINASRGNVDYLDKMLPEAIDYIKHTKGYNWQNHNLYEKVGIALCGNGFYEYGVKYLEKEWDGNYPNDLIPLFYLGAGFLKTNPQKSLKYFKEAERLICDSTDILTKKVIYGSIGFIYSNMQNYQEAIRYKELETPYVKEIDGIDSYAIHLTNWALDCKKLHQDEKALNIFKEVELISPQLSIKTKTTCLYHYGYEEIESGNYEHAIILLAKVIDVLIEEHDLNNQLLPASYNHLGRAYMLKKDFSNALIYLNKSKDIQLQLNGDVSPKTINYIKECEAK